MARMYEGKFNLNELHKQVAEGFKTLHRGPMQYGLSLYQFIKL